jgi:hypothetical protein
MRSTYYKLVERATGVIVAEGDRKSMHRLRKQRTAGAFFVAITAKPVGDKWNGGAA